jgi:hypothetical protein
MEGNYLLVNKTLIEWVAAAVLFCFGTGRIAGLDLLYLAWKEKRKLHTEGKGRKTQLCDFGALCLKETGEG